MDRKSPTDGGPSDAGRASCDQLLQATALGDIDAFGTLYRQEFPRVLRLAQGLLRDSHQAEEVAQEVMVNIWQHADQFDATLGGGGSWILRVARSRSIDRIRICEHARARDHKYTLLLAATATDDLTVRSALLHLDIKHVHSALLQLSVKHREALVLAYYSPLSYPQIAVHLDLPLGTVKTRIRDGILQLRRAVGQVGACGATAAA